MTKKLIYVILACLFLLLNSCGNLQDLKEYLQPTPKPPEPTVYLRSTQVDFIKGYEDNTKVYWHIYDADTAILRIESTISGKIEHQIPIAEKGEFKFFVDSPKRATIEAHGKGGTSVKSIVFNIYDNPTIVDYLVVYNKTGANQNRITRFADGVVFVYMTQLVFHT